jgi:hypothetical protein
MFATDLICSNGHKFEACFSNRAAFELQKKEELIDCPHCGDTSVELILLPVRMKKHSEGENVEPKRSNLLEYSEQ